MLIEIINILTGFVNRRCSEDATWDTEIDLSGCHTLEYMLLNQQVHETFDTLITSGSETVQMFNITDIDIIAQDLSHLTGPSELTLANDFNDAIDIIDIVNNILG